MSFDAEFNLRDLASQLGKETKEIRKNTIPALSYIGEEFVNRARTVNTYLDDTGNLRSSVGYAIIKNGKAVRFKTESRSASDSRISSANLINEIVSEFKEGIVLILFAGMEYAAAVESKGYDVITGSTPTSKQVEKDLKDLLGGVNL